MHRGSHTFAVSNKTTNTQKAVPGTWYRVPVDDVDSRARVERAGHPSFIRPDSGSLPWYPESPSRTCDNPYIAKSDTLELWSSKKRMARIATSNRRRINDPPSSSGESSIWSSDETSAADDSSAASSDNDGVTNRRSPLEGQTTTSIRRRIGGSDEDGGGERLRRNGLDRFRDVMTNPHLHHHFRPRPTARSFQQFRRDKKWTTKSFLHRTLKSLRRTRCGTISTCLLLCSLSLWILVFQFTSNERMLNFHSHTTLTVHERSRLRQQMRKRSVFTRINDAFWSALGYKKPIPKVVKQRGDSEALPKECKRPPWQDFNFPNCNDVHDIDLAAVLSRRSSSSSTSSSSDREAIETGYIASGLWRSVWAVDARALMTEPVVLKMMRKEHEVSTRNIDRHRRDALVMERLTSSPYIVDIYAYCGNSVISEFIDTTLDDLIFEDTMFVDGNETTITANMRLQMMLDVGKGIQALHEIPGGPIVHADLQPKQFLISPVTGTVKVNDFNRCRFMATNSTTAGAGQVCKFRIPTAPGKMRAPEEYNYEALDEKLDMYSIGNILYTMLTKREAWFDYNEREAKLRIQDGFVPEVDSLVNVPDLSGAARKLLVNLTQRAYAVQPQARLSARELAEELEALLAANRA